MLCGRTFDALLFILCEKACASSSKSKYISACFSSSFFLLEIGASYSAKDTEFLLKKQKQKTTQHVQNANQGPAPVT